jgi:hypothetical protein
MSCSSTGQCDEAQDVVFSTVKFRDVPEFGDVDGRHLNCLNEPSLGLC